MKKWWHQCTSIKRYMPEEDKFTVDDIIQDLPEIKKQGYRIIQITAPYKSAGFWPWWGLRPLDYFQINQYLGNSMDDFYRLVTACHKEEIKVFVFLNLGYADVSSDLWKTACRQQAYDTDSLERKYFLWSKTKEEIVEGTDSHFIQNDSYWQWSDLAQCYYWCHWSQDGYAEPQYNWASTSFQIYAKRVLRHWMDTGIDGVIVDAVNWYLNCNWSIIRECVVDIVHSYGETLCIPEGSTGFGDNYFEWLELGGFDAVEDQTFHSDLKWNGSAIMEAIDNRNSYILQERLKICNLVRQEGKIVWSYLSWSPSWTVSKRLLENAILIGTGHLTEILEKSYLDEFQEDDRKKLFKIIQAGNYVGLALQEERKILDGFETCFVCISSPEKFPVVCIFNLQEENTILDISLKKYGLENFQKGYDLISDRDYMFRNENLTIELKRYGYCYLALDIGGRT